MVDNEALRDTLSDYVLADAPIIYLLLGSDGVILQANRHAREVLGQDVCGKPMEEVFCSFHDPLRVDELLSTGAEPRLLSVSTVSGMPQTRLFRFYQVGEHAAAIGAIDADELETLRSGLLEANQELANLSRELYKRNAALVRLDDVKNEFLGIAAHDLRNPISTISCYSDILVNDLEGQLSDDHMEFLSGMKSQTCFMLHLLDDLLDVTAIEMGKLRLDLQRADITSLVRRGVSLNRVVANRKNITLLFEPHVDIPEFYLDPAKIQQVIDNLLSNALKYSEPGTVVEIDVRSNEGYATLTVRDQGRGIPASELHKLFTAFGKTSVSATSGEKSVGLGLAIVKKIIEAHKGRVWVDSEVGRGSAFHVSLPMVQELGEP